MLENSRGKNIIIVLAVVLIVLAGWLVFYKNQGTSPSGPSGESGSAGGVSPVSATRQSVPTGISVPNATSLNVPADVAKPVLVAPARQNSPANFRKFSIGVGGGQFTPSTVIVNVGDTVHLDITAADKDYDFTQPDYGFNVPLLKGKAKVVEFQATGEGKFTFYCKTCGGPAKGPVGYIVVGSR